MSKKLMQEKNLVIPSYIFSIVNQLHLTTNEFLLLIYFWNNPDTSFDILEISRVLKLKEEEIMLDFKGLLNKKIITLTALKDSNGKRTEIVNLDILYAMLEENFRVETKKEENDNIYSIFEHEFGRTLSSMEYEIIKNWLEKGFNEELILGALKEAVYNGVNNLRYIEAILYEWNKKGYKTMKEVNSRITKPKEETEKLFDYNWLDDNE